MDGGGSELSIRGSLTLRGTASVLVVRLPYPHQHIINVLARFDLRPELLPARATVRVDIGLLHVEIVEVQVTRCRAHPHAPMI